MFLYSILSELDYFQARKLNLPFQDSFLRAIVEIYLGQVVSRLLQSQSDNYLVQNLYPKIRG